MALIFVHRHADPVYTALSTDIVNDKISGANIKGGTVYLTDTNEWRLIQSDNTLGEYNVTGSSGAPAEYSKMSRSSDVFPLVKGALNKLRLRPQIQNEHVESSREALGEVDVATAVGQFFKTSQPNINGTSLTMQSAALFSSVDAITSGGGENKAGTMEYTSDAALQAEYIKTGATEAVRSAYTDLADVTQDGSWAIKLPLATATDSWIATLTSTNLTGVTFSVKFAQDIPYAQAKAYFVIGDGTNSKSFPLTSVASVWHTFTISEADMAVTANDLTATTPDMSAITKIGFRVDDSHPSTFGYGDSISYQAEGGTVDLELWGFGTALPTGDGTEDYTSVGTQYTTLGDAGIGGILLASIPVSLLGGKKKYHIDGFIAGTALEIPAENVVLVEDEYYAIVVKYVDTDTSVFGANTLSETSYYTNGYAWKAEVADNFIDKIDGAEGSGDYSDLMFQIFSTQDVYIDGFVITGDSVPVSQLGSVSVFAEDSEMSIVDIPITNRALGFGTGTFTLDMSDAPTYLEVGGKFEAYYNDDASDTDLTTAFFEISYRYIPPVVNG